jgi:hypothetical protein
LFRGWKFLVEEQVNDVLGGKGCQFSDGISTVVNAFGRCDKGGSASAHWDATKTGV